MQYSVFFVTAFREGDQNIEVRDRGLSVILGGGQNKLVLIVFLPFFTLGSLRIDSLEVMCRTAVFYLSQPVGLTLKL